ncbi:hypothetical protein K6L05_00255 [Salinicoccus roseus]|uniref:SGNH/GDSL hydrolase family protein n=1 Tax=Salinicoccus roseus TaxID=45670 RepID=UPI001CA78F8E|nr:SGNH/GDSL hydrolase family protein [Salinicoccus roseus]MBY8908215.1 hypothetical protein [Salinicoccus roseus]
MKFLRSIIDGLNPYTFSIMESNFRKIDQTIAAVEKLVVEGQLTEEQYAQLLQVISGLVKSGEINKDDLTVALKSELEGKRDKNVPINLNSLASDVLAAIEGGAGTIFELLSIPRDGSVTQRKTNFLKTGKNLVDDAVYRDDILISRSTGEETVSTSYKTIGPFPLGEGITYTQNKNGVVVFRDISGGFISATESGVRTFTTPSDTATAEVSLWKDDAPPGTYQIEEGTESTAYESFRLRIPKLVAEYEKGQLDGEWIKKDTITKDKLNFETPEMTMTENLYNKNDVQIGYYVNQSNGKLGANSGHTTSNKMKTSANESYSFVENGSLRIAHFDSNDIFISGALAPTSPITTPENTSYTLTSFPNSLADSFQFSKGDVLPAYEPYGYRLTNLLSDEESTAMIVNLPKKMPALVGQELNLYFDNLIAEDADDYDFDVEFGKGQQFERFFRFVPDVAETRQLTLKISKNGKVVSSKTTSIVVAPATVGDGMNDSIVATGDSTTDNMTIIKKLNENLIDDVMEVEMLGTRGTAPNNHEGRSGWTASLYVNNQSVGDVDNAFYNPSTSTFDFSYYLQNNSISTPDHFILNLGINDMFSKANDASAISQAESVIAEYNEMIASVHAHDPTINIGIVLTIPPNRSQDAFGKDYGTNQTRKRYKRNNILLVDRLIETYMDREYENIYLIPANAMIDTFYNFGSEDNQVNARNTTTVKMSSDNSGVHPATSGYWQVADAYWFWIKSLKT